MVHGEEEGSSLLVIKSLVSPPLEVEVERV
mgnify:CR=1 FL=1